MRFFDNLFSPPPQGDHSHDGQPIPQQPNVVAPDGQLPQGQTWTPTEYLAIRRLRARREREEQAERDEQQREERRHTFARYLYQTGRIGEGHATPEAGDGFVPHG